MEPRSPLPADTATEPPPRKRAGSLVVIGALALLGGLLWVTGGLAKRPDDTLKAGPGATIDQDRFTVRVVDARIATVDEPLGSGTMRALVVRLRVTNKGKESASLASDLKDGLAGVPQPGAQVPPTDIKGLAGGGETLHAQPGLPVDAEVVWGLKDPADPPRQVTLAFRKWEYVSGFTDLEKRWQVDKQAPFLAVATLPVSGP